MRPPRYTRTETLLPYQTLFRSGIRACEAAGPGKLPRQAGSGRFIGRSYSMAKLIFRMNQSLDGYVNHLEMPSGPTNFRHWIEQVREVTGRVYGDRKSVASGKSGEARVDIGGGMIFKKKRHNKYKKH